MTKDQRGSYLFAGLAILLWSTVSTAFKLSLYHISSAGLLLISSFVATLFLAAYNLFSKPDPFADFGRNLLKSLPAGLLNPYLYYLVLFTAYSRLRAQEAQALNYTWAIVLSVLCVLILKEKFRFKDLGALGISLFGVLIISSRGQLLQMRFDDALGTGLALGSSFIWAGYWILNLKDKRPNQVKLFYNFLIGFLFMALTAMVTRTQILLPEANLIIAFGGAIWVGLFEMGLAFVFWLKALQLTDNTAKISNLIFVTPFLSLLFIGIILREPIHPATVVGLVLIVISNLIQKR